MFRYVYIQDSILPSINMRFFLLLLISLSLSCSKPVPNESVVYNNDFTSGVLTNMSGGVLNSYNSQQCLGPYNRSGFLLSLSDLPKHNALIIDATLLIHDSWDGNSSAGGIDGPDVWNLSVDNTAILNTTFSNSLCEPLHCIYQSFPSDYGTVNNPPMTNAKQFFPGRCWNGGMGTTSVYHIIKTISHSSHTAAIRCMDELIQTNTADPLCDESWSLSGLIVKSVLVK